MPKLFPTRHNINLALAYLKYAMNVVYLKTISVLINIIRAIMFFIIIISMSNGEQFSSFQF
jgi:hypothetical protein